MPKSSHKQRARRRKTVAESKKTIVRCKSQLKNLIQMTEKKHRMKSTSLMLLNEFKYSKMYNYVQESFLSPADGCGPGIYVFNNIATWALN